MLQSSFSRRLGSRVLVALALSTALLSSCTPPDDAVDEAGAGDAGTNDAGTNDAGTNDAGAGDAGAGDAGATDAGGGVSTEDPCTFNQDCIEAERCECDEATGCFCRLGARGTGQSGVDRCESGNDCESSICLEGPNDELYCSGECSDDDDCGGQLPVCADIAFVGRICVREAQ